MQIIEMAKFGLKETVEVEKFLEMSAVFQSDFVEKQSGYIQRKLIKKDNMWCDLVFWESIEAANEVSVNMGKSDVAKMYGEMILPGSVTVDHYEIYQ